MSDFCINDRKVSFDYDIRTVIWYKNRYYILLAIPFEENTVNNIFCLNSELKLIWEAEDINRKYPEESNLAYEKMYIRNGIIYATDFSGRCVLLNTDTGKIIASRIVN